MEMRSEVRAAGLGRMGMGWGVGVGGGGDRVGWE